MPGSTTTTRDERLALHEAGHAVFCLYVGLPVDRVEISSARGVCWRNPLEFDVLLLAELGRPVGSLGRAVSDSARARWPAARADFLRRRLLVTVAGAVAANVLSNDCVAIANKDLEQAQDLARLIAPGAQDRVLDDAQTACANEIDRRLERPIRQLSDRLLAERTVAGDALAETWQDRSWIAS
jgi:hypothetical protein